MSTPQAMEALARANEVRLAAADLKRDLQARRITLGEALYDERAACMTAAGLLLALPRVGRTKMVACLGALRIPEHKRLVALTGRQRLALQAEAFRRNLTRTL